MARQLMYPAPESVLNRIGRPASKTSRATSCCTPAVHVRFHVHDIAFTLLRCQSSLSFALLCANRQNVTATICLQSMLRIIGVTFLFCFGRESLAPEAIRAVSSFEFNKKTSDGHVWWGTAGMWLYFNGERVKLRSYPNDGGEKKLGYGRRATGVVWGRVQVQYCADGWV